MSEPFVWNVAFVNCCSLICSQNLSYPFYLFAVCTCAVRNCLECRYRQQVSQLSENNVSALVNNTSSAPSGDQMTPIQALIAGAQAPVKTGFLTKEPQVKTFFSNKSGNFNSLSINSSCKLDVSMFEKIVYKMRISQ